MPGTKEWLTELLQRFRKALYGGSLLAQHVAVLIDGDGTSPHHADLVFAYARSLGHVASAQLHANFAALAPKAWSEPIRAHGITAVQHFRRKRGRNGADIALVIGALDLLHRGEADEFVIVAADSDFSALAHKLRQSGARVHGVGRFDASVTFRESCDVFVTFDQLAQGAHPTVPVAQPLLLPRPPSDAEQPILVALVRLGGARRWITVDDLDVEVRRAAPDFDPRVYRRHRLLDILEALDSVELSTNSRLARIRLASLVRNGEIPRGNSEVLEEPHEHHGDASGVHRLPTPYPPLRRAVTPPHASAG